MLIGILLAVGPQPVPKPIVWAEDYPPGALNRGEQVQVIAELLITPEGAVDTCSILMSSSFQDLDDATCKLIMRRAKFIPAKDDAGRPEYSYFRTPPITWSLGTFQRPRHPRPDFELSINRAPAGYHLPLEFKVEFRATATGSIKNCSIGKGEKAPPQLVEIACQSAAQPPVRIPRDRHGKAVDARDQATFRFTLDDSTGK